MPSLGLTLTLADHTKTYSLLALIQAVTGYANTRPTCRELTLTGDAGNNADFIYIGGSAVSSSNYGVRLQPGQSQTYRSTLNDISLADTWLIGTADGDKVDVSSMEY